MTASSSSPSGSLPGASGGRVGQLANQPADRLLEPADLVITVGYDPVEYPTSEWNRTNSHKLIHVDVVRADLDNCYRPYVGLTGDIAQTLEALTPQLKRSKRPALSSSILQAIVAARNLLSQEAASLGGTPIHPLRIVHELQPFLTTDLTLCLDMGSFHLWMARHLYSFRARQILITNGQQTLGVALPWGIAASIVRPADKIVLDEAHARHLLRTYCVYYNKTRTHLSLSKDAPDRREVHRPERGVKIVGLPILGGLHHRYERRAA